MRRSFNTVEGAKLTLNSPGRSKTAGDVDQILEMLMGFRGIWGNLWEISFRESSYYGGCSLEKLNHLISI